MIESHGVLIGTQIPLVHCTTVLACFQCDNLGKDKDASILENFHYIMQVAFFGNLKFGDGSTVPSFPHTFKLTIQEVACSVPLIKHILELFD